LAKHGQYKNHDEHLAASGLQRVACRHKDAEPPVATLGPASAAATGCRWVRVSVVACWAPPTRPRGWMV
jgi:hypothetical protein